MDATRDLYTVKEGKASLREYVICATNKHRFEVKNGSQVVYEGESYQQAKSLYHELTDKRAAAPEEVIRVTPIQPKRRLRAAYAQAS